MRVGARLRAASAAVLLWACGGGTTGEAPGELGARKLDVGLDPGALYVRARRDTRSCPPPRCGGFFVQRVNYATTPCPDGRAAAECYLRELDLAGLGLGPVDVALVRALPEAFLLRGYLGPVLPGSLDFGLLRVTEAWEGALGVASSGAFWRLTRAVSEGGVPPCSPFRAEALNRGEAAVPITRIEIAASPEGRCRALAQLGAAEGLLVAAELAREGTPLDAGLDATAPSADGAEHQVARVGEFYLPFSASTPSLPASEPGGCECHAVQHFGQCSTVDAATPNEPDAACVNGCVADAGP